MRKYDIIIFDIDGTLFDSIEFNYRCLNYTASEFGFTSEIKKEKIKENLGKVQHEFFAAILPEEMKRRWEEIRDKNRLNFEKIMPQYGKSFPFVKETLCKLKENGYKIALYSNCSPPYKREVIKNLGLENIFDYTECTGDNNLNKKEIVEKIIKKFGGMAVVTGDRQDDIDAAKENGAAAIWASYGFGKDIINYDYKIERFEDLLIKI